MFSSLEQKVRHLLILIYCFHRKHISRGSDMDLACAHADREELDRVVTEIQRDAAAPERSSAPGVSLSVERIREQERDRIAILDKCLSTEDHPAVRAKLEQAKKR